jgi:sugar (pentulose or hexulose) kinase
VKSLNNTQYLLGIDAGTSGIKAVIFDCTGKEVFTSSQKNETILINNVWMEQDMNLLWIKMCNTIKSAISMSNINPKDIISIGITGQGEGCWLVDHLGNPVRNAILWSDGRATEIVENIKKNNILYEQVKSITGSHPFNGATSVILKWLEKNEPDTIKQTYSILFCKDYLRYKLTGNLYMDVTDASTSIIDIKNKSISKELFNILGINKFIDKIPEIIEPCKIAGYVSNEASKLTGLMPDTPVAAGLMDIVATAVGAGAVEKGDICTILGTTCCNEIVKDTIDFIDNNSGYECHGIDGLYLNVIAAMSGTPNIDWIIKSLFQSELEAAKKNNIDFFSIIEEKMNKIPAGCDGVIYHPYIGSGGERAPFLNSNAKAQFFGISSSTTKYHLLKSVYEGIAFSIKDCLIGSYTSGKVYLTGGGSKSEFWAQIISDCLGKELIVLDGYEYTAKGAALSAAVACGLFKTLKEASVNSIKIKKRYLPDKRKSMLYDSMYTLYLEIRKTNNRLWDLRKDILYKNKL